MRKETTKQKQQQKQRRPEDTSWEKVAGWYDGLLAGERTYQKDLILPNLLRLMDVRRGDRVLDLACGQGFFAAAFAAAHAHVIGADASKNLIEIARRSVRHNAKDRQPEFRIAPADSLGFLKDASVDKIAIILALQNMENVGGVLRECARVLAPGGAVFIVMNHPAFRIPKKSSWGWDDAARVQYRRVDKYLSESKTQIEMHPGAAPGEFTLSFHRPLQFYFKALDKAGFAVTALEEWNSHKKSEPGPRAAAEDVARKEIPLFLFMKAVR